MPTLRFSTDDLPEKDRLPFWCDAVGRGTAKMDIEPSADVPSRASIAMTSLPGCLLVCGSNSSTTVYRRPPELLGDSNEDLVLIFKPGTAGEAARSGGRAALCALIRREIDQGFLDPDFSLPTLARRLKISPRYVQMLLEQAHSSFLREVTGRRLQRAHDLLRSPSSRHLTIANIALASGFGTLPHFHRQFRRRYDLTPGELRNRFSKP